MKNSIPQRSTGKGLIQIVLAAALAVIILAVIVHVLQIMLFNHANAMITSGVVSGLLPGIAWYSLKKAFPKEK